MEKKEKVYSSSYGTKKEKGKDSKTKLADEKTDRLKAIKEYEESVLERQKEAELNIRQQNIELKEDGYEKEKEQINLNYDRLIAENEKRRNDMLKDLREKKVNEWLNKNPKATKTETENYRNSLKLDDSSLTSKQQEQLQEYDKIAREQKSKAETDLRNKLLDEFQNF